MTGQFIVLEGPDGAGTTLHSGLLAEALRADGREVVLTHEPSDGDIGQWIRSELKAGKQIDPTALQLLFCADRADHVSSIIQPALEHGATVITDRYALSTLIYGEALGIDVAWLQSINDTFLKPTITLLLLPPFAVCQERLARRAERDQLEGDAFQQQVYRHYAKVQGSGIIHIDSSGEKIDVAKAIHQAVHAASK